MEFYESEIYPPQWPIDVINEPQLEIEDILAVQSLIMGYLHRRARTSRSDAETKNHLLSMINNSNGATIDLNNPNGVYDGSTDTYMSCKVQKRDRDQWNMVVSFLESTNTEETKTMNTREVYRFDWLANGNRQAWYRSTTKSRIDEGLKFDVNGTHPISSEECIDLQDRMLEISQNAGLTIGDNTQQ